MLNGSEIKSKLVLNGISQVDIVNMLTDYGYTISKSELSTFLSLHRRTPKAEIILSEVERIIAKVENENGN